MKENPKSKRLREEKEELIKDFKEFNDVIKSPLSFYFWQPDIVERHTELFFELSAQFFAENPAYRHKIDAFIVRDHFKAYHLKGKMLITPKSEIIDALIECFELKVNILDLRKLESVDDGTIANQIRAIFGFEPVNDYIHEIVKFDHYY